MRRLLLIGLCAVAAACQPQSAGKSGKIVARGNGITVSADDFKARIDEQSPFLRARYSTLERKKEFLDNLVRFEVLAKEAERQGLDKDPEVRNTLKKIMVQRLVARRFQGDAGAPTVADAELQKYYDEHTAEYNRPRKVRVAAVILSAPAAGAERTKKLALARRALAKLKVEEKKNSLAFAQIVSEFSEDAATKAAAGDLQFRTRDEFEKTYSKQLADAAFALKTGETSAVVESPSAIYILKFTGEQPELNRTFDQVKAQIAVKLQRERQTKDFDEWVRKLKDQAAVKVDDQALESVEVTAAPPPGMPGMGGPMVPNGGPMGGHAMPVPTSAPAPHAAPAAK